MPVALKYVPSGERPVSDLSQYIPEEDLQLDHGIKDAVCIFQEEGIETYESCEGGPGHAYPGPTIRFLGDNSEGYRAYAAALRNGLSVSELRRIWVTEEGNLSGPYWEITFVNSS